MSDHARLAPSSGHRILTCQGSVREEPLYPDVPQEYTAEGTLAHDLANMMMADGVDLQTKVGKRFEVDGFTFVVSQEMVDYVRGYVAFVEKLGVGADVVMGEQKVRYGPLVFNQPGDHQISVPFFDKEGGWYERYLTPEQIGFGRCDWSAVFTAKRKIHIVDLKYGYTRVWAEENEQGMLYALGILYEFAWMGEFDEIEIGLYQPRVDPEKPYNSWTVSVADLHAFAARFREAALASLKPGAEFNPGVKQCQFCRAKAHCRARREANFEVLTGLTPATPDDFDQLPVAMALVVDTRADDVEWLAKVMRHADQIEDWVKAVRGEVERKLMKGEEVPGFKLVEGRLGDRKWNDDAAAEAQLKAWKLKREEMYKSSLISPTAAEKVLKSNKARWAKMQQYISRAPGRPSVAPIEDQRSRLSLTATPADFV